MSGAVGGCSRWGREPDPPPPDPLEPLLAAVRELIERYQAVLADYPAEQALLEPIAQAHLAHETALLTAIGRSELATPTGSPRVGEWVAPSSPSASPPPDESEFAAVLVDLQAAELAAQDEATLACLSAPPHRAALLGSIAAARATHAEVLR